MTDEFRPLKPTKLRHRLAFRWKESWLREAMWRVWYFIHH